MLITRPMNLATQWHAAASREPKKTALFWGDELYTHAQLLTQAYGVAGELRRLGVKSGDRVGLWLKNCPGFIPSLFGIFMANAAAVPINNFLKVEEVAYMVQDAGIRHLITDASMAEMAQKLVEKCPGLVIWLIENTPVVSPKEVSLPPVSCEREEKDLAVLIYTSGTTGRPKGAMLTHGNLLHNIRSCQKMLESTYGDRFVLLLPMFHSFMLTVCVLLPLCTGASIVLIKSVHPAKNIIMEILRHQGTILPAVPSFFRLFAQAELPPQLPLRLCISGGAALPVEILREFNRKFPLPLLEGYGLSETSPVASLNPIRGPWKEGSIGIPIPDVEMSVQDDQGNQLGPREIGEICIRGGNVMAGYWNQPEATAAVMRGDWLLTGDVGYKDEDGYFYITDRKKDMLIVNGINVYPREIEELIYQFPGIREAAVIGVPDVRRGEQPVAFVSLNEGAQLDEYALLRWLRERIAHYKVPRKVTVLPALPRNATGKILKTELRRMVTEQVE